MANPDHDDSVRIRARETLIADYPDGRYRYRFSVADIIKSKDGSVIEAVRGNIGFRDANEVRRAIKVLEGVLPAVDRLGDIVRVQEG